MTWEEIIDEITVQVTEFKRIYKCLNKKKLPSDATVQHHITAIIEQFNKIKIITSKCYALANKNGQVYLTNNILSLRDKLVGLFKHLGLKIKIPITLENLIDVSIEDDDSDIEIEDNMAPPSTIEFINAYSKFVPEFDGKVSNLTRFLDALNFIDDNKETHENTAVRMIKTKLIGKARDYITDDDNTIKLIRDKLKNNIKGETTKSLNTKLLAVRQLNKTANEYVKEIEEITDSLKTAYITEGLTPSLAETYSTDCAVKAMIKNANNDKVKLLMEAGEFSDLNQAVTKFVSASTDTKSHSVLYMSNRNFYNDRNRNNRNRRFFNNRNNGYNYNNNSFKRFPNRNSYSQQNPSSSGGNRGNERRRFNSRNPNIRYTRSENLETPLETGLGEGTYQARN